MIERLPVVILISGRGTNMCALADRARDGTLPIEVRAVISDRADAAGLVEARAREIPTATLSLKQFATRLEFDDRLADVVESFGPKLVILAGYMKILSATFVTRFIGRLMNIHPSLLPKYTGLHTHRRVLEAGDAEHGASVHFVTEELDGGPLIVQSRVPVLRTDTEQTLAARVQRVEHMIYPMAVDWFARGRLSLRDGRPMLDGEMLTRPVIAQPSEVV